MISNQCLLLTQHDKQHLKTVEKILILYILDGLHPSRGVILRNFSILFKKPSNKLMSFSYWISNLFVSLSWVWEFLQRSLISYEWKHEEQKFHNFMSFLKVIFHILSVKPFPFLEYQTNFTSRNSELPGLSEQLPNSFLGIMPVT